MANSLWSEKEKRPVAAYRDKLFPLYRGRYSPNQFRYSRRVLWKLFKTAVQLGRNERTAEAYSEYVEALSEARTTPAVVFNSFLLVVLVFRV